MTTKPTGPVHEFERSTRMPLDAVVRLHFEGTVAYQNGFAANVSASGMYVKHPDPPPVGTRLVFEFTVGSQRKPVQGVGEVVWSRDKYDGPGRPAGAGIRFVDLDELSRQHIAEAIFEFLEASLGDRVAEHPEARALVASVPTHAPLEFGGADESQEIEPDPASLRTQSIPAFTRTVSQPLPLAGAAPETGSEPEPAMTPFRIFDDEPGPAAPIASPAVFVPPEPGERAPVARPFRPPMPPAPLAGAAAARSQPRGSKALGVVMGLLVAGLAGGAVWWFYLRPQSAATPAATSSGPSPAAAPARPSPPPLDPKPGPGRTLVESVGRSPAAPETQIPPPAGEPAVASAAPVAAVESPAAAPPPAPAAPAETPATAVEAIRAETTGSGATVTIAANGGFAEGGFVWSEIGGDKPRVLIKLRGMRQPFRGSPAGLPTPALRGVRVGYHATAAGNEVHVVLDLPTDGRVRVDAVEPAGRALVVRLSRS